MQTLVRHASVKRFHPSDQIVHFLNLICRGARRLRHCARTVSYTHLTLPTN